MSKQEVNQNIINGMATILWGNAWAQHIESASDRGVKPCQNISGCKIEEVMPSIPKIAFQLAKQLIVDIVKSNSVESIADLCENAYRSDTGHTQCKCTFSKVQEEELESSTFDDDYQIRFGECLAWMAIGAGVNWFDTHEEFLLTIPTTSQVTATKGTFHLEGWAIENCTECSECK